VLQETRRKKLCGSRTRKNAWIPATKDERYFWFRYSQDPKYNENAAVQRCSDEPDVTFDRLDHRVHLPGPYLFGKAKGEAFGRVKRNMRRKR
jgi:hypothetical protein